MVAVQLTEVNQSLSSFLAYLEWCLPNDRQNQTRHILIELCFVCDILNIFDLDIVENWACTQVEQKPPFGNMIIFITAQVEVPQFFYVAMGMPKKTGEEVRRNPWTTVYCSFDYLFKKIVVLTTDPMQPQYFWIPDDRNSVNILLEELDPLFGLRFLDIIEDPLKLWPVE